MTDQTPESTSVSYEYRVVGVVTYRDADHSLCPKEPHNCRCTCTDILAPWCKEHGSQVPKERRTVRTVRTIGEWEPAPATEEVSR